MADIDIKQCWMLLFDDADLIRHLCSLSYPEQFKNTTLSQLKVMSRLFWRRPESIMLKELAEEMNVTPGAASQTIDVLVKRGLVERTVSDRDRRAVAISLSGQGDRQRKRYADFFNLITRQALAGVSQERLDIFMSVLDELSRELHKLKKNQDKGSAR